MVLLKRNMWIVDLTKVHLKLCNINVLVISDQNKPLKINTKVGPLWAVSSTQTSPRVNGSDAIADEPLLRPSVTATTTTTSKTSGSGIPKLGEIEQFSTETQTDDLEILLKPNEDAFNTIEAQTQFDLDDILCSNYTQTALFDTSLDQTSIGVNTIETQTMLMSDDLVHMETQTMSMIFEDQ